MIGRVLRVRCISRTTAIRLIHRPVMPTEAGRSSMAASRLILNPALMRSQRSPALRRPRRKRTIEVRTQPRKISNLRHR